MQLSKNSIKLLENELGYSYYLWEVACDEAWDRSDPTISERKKSNIDHLKQKFNEWVKLINELGLVVVWDNETTAQFAQATFNIITKECLSMLQKLGFKEQVVQFL